MKKLTSLFLLLILLLVSGCQNQGADESKNASAGKSSEKEVVKIAIGYQTVTAQTWGALILKNKKILENELQSAYPDKKFEIEWVNAQSGPPLTNNMIAKKLQFAVMGDLPILVNGEKGQNLSNYNSVFIAFDGKGVNGANQAILIPKDSTVKSVKDLAGKQISTPIGSSAHRMLELALKKYGILDKVEIVSQDVNVGLSNIQQNKIAAHATWEPFPSLAVSNQYGKVLLDGAETGVDYLDGIVADKDWIEANKGYTIAFLKALIKAHQFVIDNPQEASKVFAAETEYPLNICENMVKNISFEAAIHQKDIETIKGSLDFAISVGNVKKLDLKQFIDDSYLREAYKELNKDYPGDVLTY